jgi:leucyl-tRNA synthetase
MDFVEIWKKWQKTWKEKKTYKVNEDKNKKSFYILDMFPYPSGAGLHVGHPKGYIATDVIARKHMLQWECVLHPMGFDTFGLGTEQYAIANKIKPQVAAAQNIATYKRQLEMFGCTYDWDREVNTANPKYFKWTQKTFLDLYNSYFDEKEQKAKSIHDLEVRIEKWDLKVPENMTKEEFLDSQRLAYVDYKPINRCPKCKTWLANEDLDSDGTCERCGTMVEQKTMRQWVIRITKYAERLLEWLDKLPEWTDSSREQQRNWIWKSEWTQFEMKVASHLTSSDIRWEENKFEVYTTRIDTVFGMSFVVMAPEHDLVDKITTEENKQKVEEYKEAAKHKTQLERTELQKDKTWIFTGAYAINPFNDEKIPIYVGDYVLANYGTGVVMAVPAHDERDFEFAKKYGIEIKHVIGPKFWKKHEEDKAKESWYAVIYDEKNDKFLVWVYKEWLENHYWFPGGTIEEWETLTEWTIREVEEETWFHDLKYINDICCSQSFYFANSKNVHRENNAKYLLFKLNSEARKEKKLTEYKKDSPIMRVSSEEILKDTREEIWPIWRYGTKKFVVEMTKRYFQWNAAYTEKWILVNSWEFSGLTSDQAIESMQKWLEKHNIWWKKVNYRLQDWVFSRQRYWGEPIPMIHCDNCDVKLSINFYNQEIWDKLLSGDKTIESRALNPEEKERYFGDVKEWDIVKWILKEKWDTQNFRVKKVWEYAHLEDLFLDKIVCQGICGSNMDKYDTYEKFEKWYESLSKWYLDKINKNWIVCWEFEKVGAKIVPLEFKDLPLELPDVENYEPTGTEEWPLADIDEWINVKCPKCGWNAKRESNTMPGWAGSSRYWMRYMDPDNQNELVSSEKERFWHPVDVYVWWAEHITRHMIYARFWHKFLQDLWTVSVDEPFKKYQHVGLIMAEDGRKMSKRRWNVINPDDIINEFGSDTLRVYEMFMWPFDQAVAWNTSWVKWVKKFLDKVVNLYDKIDSKIKDDKKILNVLHQTIKKVTEDIDRFSFNTAISQMMILVNELSAIEKISKDTFEKLVLILAPFAPHLAEELWEKLWNHSNDGAGNFSIFHQNIWPEYDEKYLVEDIITIAVQINGKVRGTIEISPNSSKDEVFEIVKQNEKINKYLQWEILKIIYIPSKICNIIVK